MYTGKSKNKFKNKTKTHLDLGKYIEPSMNTDPDSKIYQHVDSSPVLE